MKRNNLLFLSEASKILSSSLDYHVTLASTANLVVSNIADFCIIDIFQPDGKLERVAVKVKDAKYTKLANRMYKYPPDPRNKGAIYDTARTGDPILIKRATHSWLHSVSQLSGEHEVIRKLQLNSHIFVPLKSRGMVIGVLTVASQNPNFSYSKSDLLLVEELGIRAGIAVDKARLYSEAQEAIYARDEFLSIASHELKTPLTSILLHLQAALAKIRKSKGDENLQEHIAPMLESTEKQIKRMTKLINELLDVSVVSTGKLQLEKEEVFLGDIIHDVLERFKVQIEHSGNAVSTKIDPRVKGLWDKVRLEQVVSNFFSNALKYGNKKPISIEVKHEDDKATFLIKDGGIGIDPKKKKIIFERFKRGVSEKEYTGLGLGLYISKQIIDAHGGAIQLKSQIGKGTTFIIQLPLKN